ncbi:MAG: pyrroloquinoline quinone biosynthesis peptide chaperone PqqD [Pseudomonadota bacterium]
MASITGESVPSIAAGYRLQWEEAQNGYVLLYPEGVVQLNGSSAEIMKRIDGEQTVAGIIVDLKNAFPGAELDDDVIAFLDVAANNGWLDV